MVLGRGCLQPLAGVALAPRSSDCSLGVLPDLGLLLDDQVAAVARRAYHQLWLVQQLRPFLGKKDLNMVTHALDKGGAGIIA